MDNINMLLKNIIKGMVGFIKGQMILSSVTFVILCVGLIVTKAPLPVLIALGITIMDILPVIGSGIVMIPWAVISFIAGDTYKAAGIGITYLALTIIRQILDPIIIGHKIGVRPIYTLLSSVLGSIIFGPLGFILGPIIAMVLTIVSKSIKDTKKRSTDIE